MTTKKELREAANKEAVERIVASRPVLIDVEPAGAVIPGMTEKTVLHAGPPITWESMCAPMKGGILGAIQYEGWAQDAQEAERLIKDGEVTLSPCHHHNAIGTMGSCCRDLAEWRLCPHVC